MKVNLEYNGNKVELELTAEQIKQLGIEEKKKSGWERVANGYWYYRIEVSGGIIQDVEASHKADNELYTCGNYFADKNLAKKMSKRIGLMLRMQRWANEHNYEKINWRNTNQRKYYIYYNCNNQKLSIDYGYCLVLGATFFCTEELAKQAIEIFGDEIIEAYIKE